MQAAFWKNIIRFVFLILLQGLFLDRLYLPGNLHLIVFPLAILLLPIQVPASAVLLISFFSGFCVDLMSGVPGLNTAAATWLGFIRILYFRIRNRRETMHDNDLSGTPLPANLGLGGFLSYSLWMVTLFHLAYFFVDAFSFHHFFYTVYLSLGSSALCFLVLWLIIGLFRPRTNIR